jgi:hypothetical protein
MTVTPPQASPTRLRLRISPLAWLVVVFSAVCITPVVQAPAAAILYLIPVIAALYLLRTYTIVDSTGVTISGLVRQVHLSWSEIESIGTGGAGAVYAELADGSTLRLMGAHPVDLEAITALAPTDS